MFVDGKAVECAGSGDEESKDAKREEESDRISTGARHHDDVEHIPLDSGPGKLSPSRTRPFASVNFAGHLFLTAILFAGVFVGGTFSRSVTTPNIAITRFHRGTGPL